MKSVKLNARNFKCPITGEFIKDPVVAPNGISFERSAIEALLESRKSIPQYSGRRTTKEDLIPNRALKSLLEAPEVAQQLKDNKAEITIKESDMPQCPITMDETFNKPVLADDGHTYEEGALKEHITKSGSNSPMTRAPIVKPLRANKFVEALTEEYKKQNKVQLEKENQESEKLVAEQSKHAPASEMEYSNDYDGYLSPYEAHSLAALAYGPRQMMMSFSLPQYFYGYNSNCLVFGRNFNISCFSTLSSPSANILVTVHEFDLTIAEFTVMPFATNHFKHQQMIVQQQDESGLVVAF